MTNESDEKKQRRRISRRALLVTSAQLLGIGALGARAKYLQIDQNEHYVLLADDNRIDEELEPSPRGLIYDSEGIVVAANRPDFRVDIDTLEPSNPELTINNLSKILNLSDSRKEALVRLISESRERGLSSSINIADHLTWEQYSLVNENLPVLEGVQAKVALSRFYPYRDLLAHQVGYVGRVSERDMEKMETVPPVYYTPNMAIGKTGIEAKRENDLRGVETKVIKERNAKRRVVRELKTETGIIGNSLQLTLDAKFQHYAMERLKGQSASVVVIDVKNGDVKLLTSCPSFDANLFVFGISQTNYDELINNPYFPLNHKAVQGVYPPGSTFKMVTALAALEAGTVAPGDHVFCSGKINRGRDFYCWKSSGHGSINLKNSLKHSCDVYYYTVGERTSIDNISVMARKLGLGQQFEIPQSAISSGLIPSKAWKKERYDEEWVPGDTLNASIGQGYILATPLQLAVMTARIASGKEIEPNLISRINGVPIERKPIPHLDVSDEHLQMVREGMYAVSNEPQGTAYGTRINAGGRKWAGKTGTAQVVAISKSERESGVVRNEDRKWERRDHALFVAFAPFDDPQYAISVVLEHGGGGSSAAAPIARDMMLYALYGGIPPTSAYPTGGGAAAEFWKNAPPFIPYNDDGTGTPEPANEKLPTAGNDKPPKAKA